MLKNWIDYILLLFGIYCVSLGYFNIQVLIKTMILLFILIMYKYIGHWVGIVKGSVLRMDIDEAYWERELKARRMHFQFHVEWYIWEYRQYSRLWRYIFLFLKWVPWNWMSLFIIWVWEKGYKLRILINSNKDIYYKKKGINKVYSYLGMNKWRYYYIIEWVVVFPFLRLLLIPLKLRVKIFLYPSIWELLRINVIVILYSVVYMCVIYYVYITIFNICVFLGLLYLYLAIVWPSILYMKYKYFENENDYMFLNPCIYTFQLAMASVTRTIMEVLRDQLLMSENWDSIDFFKYDKRGFKPRTDAKVAYSGEGIGDFDIENFWKLEKLYGISLIARRGMLFHQKDWDIRSEAMFWYELGIDKLGEEYMKKKYDTEYIKFKELFRCYLFLDYDIVRLAGDWNYDGTLDSRKVLVIDEVWEGRDALYEGVYESYSISFELYEKIVLYEYYINNLFRYTIGSLSCEYLNNYVWYDKEYVIFDLMKKEGIILETGEELRKIWNNEERENFWESVNQFKEEMKSKYEKREKEEISEIILNLYGQYTVEYIKEQTLYLKNKEDKYSLISEKYILAFKEKYIK